MGLSVAVFTGFKKAEAHQTMDAEATALLLGMTAAERMQYEAWQSGAVMPVVEWNKSVSPVPNGSGSAKRYEHRAEAVNHHLEAQGSRPRTCLLDCVAHGLHDSTCRCGR